MEENRRSPQGDPTLEEQVKQIKTEIADLAEKLGTSEAEVVLILVQREAVIINQQLSRLQQQMDAVYARVWGEKRG